MLSLLGHGSGQSAATCCMISHGCTRLQVIPLTFGQNNAPSRSVPAVAIKVTLLSSYLAQHSWYARLAVLCCCYWYSLWQAKIGVAKECSEAGVPHA